MEPEVLMTIKDNKLNVLAIGFYHENEIFEIYTPEGISWK